jgi:tellurite resistance protein
MIDAPTALIYTMVLVSAADSDMTDVEFRTIGSIVKQLPVFKKFELDRLPETTANCAERLAEPNGLDKLLQEIVSSLPKRLHETAYALACDVAAADAHASQEELRLLELLLDNLEIGALEVAAIERGARARHTVL